MEESDPRSVTILPNLMRMNRPNIDGYAALRREICGLAYGREAGRGTFPGRLPFLRAPWRL